MVLRGGGIPNLEVIQNEVYKILTGRALPDPGFPWQTGHVRRAKLNQQRDDIGRAIDSTDRLLSYAGTRTATPGQSVDRIPPIGRAFRATYATCSPTLSRPVGRISNVTGQTLSAARGNLHQDLQELQRPLKQLGRAATLFGRRIDASVVTSRSPSTACPKIVRGDYINVSRA